MAEIKKEELVLDDSVKQNKSGQPILGRLEGICADFISPTRNGRKYDESLWEKVFNSEIINEYFECGGIPGELDHPTDRLETCSEKIAIMMPEKPTKDADGHLVAKFDILDTPNGRIAYTLAKYGYKLGISSRGNGDVYQDVDGEHVDEDSYDFQGFDLVLLPAVKAARLKMVESLQNGKTFSAAINEALDKANPDEKKIMTETLNNLNIKYTPEKVIDKSDIAANNVGATMVKELQESLLAKQKAEAQVLELQEKLSVCYAKEAKYEEDIVKYKQTIRNLSESVSSAKALQKKVDLLNEDLKEKDRLLTEEKDRTSKILSKQEAGVARQSSLMETLTARNLEVKKLKANNSALNESIENIRSEYTEKENLLKESLAEVKKNLTIKTTEYNNKLSNANKLVEQYRRTAKTAVNKYIESQAIRLGVGAQEIKNKLPENYSFDDIDSVCESLSQYKLNLSKLPINLQKTSKIKVTESKETITQFNNDADDCDDSLLTLAGLK